MKRFPFFIKCLLFPWCISFASYSMERKRKVEMLKITSDTSSSMRVPLAKAHYKVKLQKAVAECMTTCEIIEESDYISKTGYHLFRNMLKRISVQYCSPDVLANEHRSFLDFFAEIIRKINPAVYNDTVLGESLDEVNEAFNLIADQKRKARQQRVKVNNLKGM